MDPTKKTEETTREQDTLVKEIRLTWSQLAEKLSLDKIELREGQTLIINHIDPNDFLALVEETEPTGRLRLLVEIMQRYSLEVSFEGSIMLGSFELSDGSWTILTGEGKYLQISARPLTVRKTIAELVSFLKKLPEGQAWVLKPSQKLFIEELSSNAMVNYYQRCQATSDIVQQEAEQDQLFTDSCDTLSQDGLLLKVYAMNATQINRYIDSTAGGILFTPEGNKEFKSPRVVLGLVKNKP